ncbi:MAG: xanthine dehydrogenase family protein subunit M, partial [Acidobacteriota bacterium]|nr:xanthine dehydrogenase family protein subunit M [Acidobacteriota bacterium]
MTIRVYSPTTLEEAYAILRERGAQLHVLAGGTDLMVSINLRLLAPHEVLNIWSLRELRGIHEEETTLRLGALTTYTEIIHSPLVQRHCSILVEAAKTIGAVQTQNRGTIGGNIVNASPAGDTLPVLAVFDAELELGSARGTRRVSINEFYTGYRQTIRQPDELLLAVRIPKQQPDERTFFYKVGTRQAQAISKVVIAAKARVQADGLLNSIQIGLGSVAPTVVRAWQTEAFLTNKILSPQLIEQAKEVIQRDIHPITDFRSTESYRRHVTATLLVRFLQQCL